MSRRDGSNERVAPASKPQAYRAAATAQGEHASMRLTTDQIEAIRQRIHSHLGADARIWLFGSRVDDSRRGGDVDLYVEPETQPGLAARLQCKSAIADALDLDVDLIVQQPGRDLPIYRIAKQSGVTL